MGVDFPASISIERRCRLNTSKPAGLCFFILAVPSAPFAVLVASVAVDEQIRYERIPIKINLKTVLFCKTLLDYQLTLRTNIPVRIEALLFSF